MSKSLVAIRPKGYNSIIWTTNDICPFKCWYCPESIWGGNTKTPFTWNQCSDFLDVIYVVLLLPEANQLIGFCFLIY